jgi:hypothetical protein
LPTTHIERDGEWSDWLAIIAPTDVATTFGIFWEHAPAMERRGGYSGPYSTREEAEQGARDWLTHWDVTKFRIEHREQHP